MVLSKEDLRNVLLDSYDLVVRAPWEKKYKVKSRTKMKSMITGLRQFDEPDTAVLHFVKFAEYFLLRSNLHQMLDVLLEKVNEIQHSTERSDDVRERIQYLIGYACWSMDALCEIFKECDKSGKNVEEHVRRMIETELGLICASDGVDAAVEDTVKKIMKWHSLARSME